jgi:hypothetical protein
VIVFSARGEDGCRTCRWAALLPVAWRSDLGEDRAMSELGAGDQVSGGHEANIDADAVRAHLADHVRHGRTVEEAVGEERWLTAKHAMMGVLPRKTVEEIVGVTEDWLAAATAGDLELADMRARSYADFLATHVDLDEQADPPREVVDRAWRDWRTRAEGGSV